MERGELEQAFDTPKREDMGQYSSAKALNDLDDSIIVERVDNYESNSGPI